MAHEDGSPVVQAAPLPPPNKGLPPTPANDANHAVQHQHTSSLSSAGSRTASLKRKPVPTHSPPAIPSFSFAEHGEDRDTEAGARDSKQSQASWGMSSTTSRETADMGAIRDSGASVPSEIQEIPIHQLSIRDAPQHARYSHAAELEVADMHDNRNGQHYPPRRESMYQPYQYHEDDYHHEPAPPQPTFSPREHAASADSASSKSNNSGPRNEYAPYGPDVPLQVPRTTHARPSSGYGLGAELPHNGGTHSPRLSVAGGSPSSSSSPVSYGRTLSANRRSPDQRPTSYIDLLNLPYNQQIAPTANLGNAQLRTAVGQNASLMDTKKTLEMYRANVKKTNDNVVQYEFALYMVGIAREIMEAEPGVDTQGLVPADILREARQILQRLADRSYPFAQYYLADGYASGLFNKDKPDYDRAFPLFVAASKHGHAESGYRTALCYEFGWGCRKDYAKAVQFYRAAASKNHPGAATRLGKACLAGDMGLTGKYREGVKWLKRAAEAADFQYNSAPYELGLLHETGFGDDIFKDEVYAVQLFTQAAELGHPYAALKLGEAYEHGYLQCPKDAALSVHYYNCAAQANIPEAMMNLCAWYMVGAEPVLEKDENEAYEWAKRAAELGMYPSRPSFPSFLLKIELGTLN